MAIDKNLKKSTGISCKGQELYCNFVTTERNPG
jgi:hypothetical protein